MRLVIDSNRVIAALIKDSTTREILNKHIFEFFAPDTMKEEIDKYLSEIIEKAGITKDDFNTLVSLIFEKVSLVPQGGYQHILDGLKSEMKDPSDVPYIAVCLSKEAEGIWSHDPHFLEQKKCKVFTNIDLIRLSEKMSRA